MGLRFLADHCVSNFIIRALQMSIMPLKDFCQSSQAMPL
jgi:hypothetical protein